MEVTSVHRWLYALEDAGEGPAAIQAELAQTTRFYQDAVDGMLATGQFDIARRQGVCKGQMLSHTQYRACKPTMPA